MQLNLCILRPLESTTETANGSVQPFLHSSLQKVPVLYNGRPYPPELSLPMRDCIVFFLLMVSLLHYLAIQPSRLQVCCNKISCQLSVVRDLDLPCNTWCFRPMRAHNPNDTSIGSAVFAQMTAECLYSLQWFTCFPLKIAPSSSGAHVIRGSLVHPSPEHKW